MRRVGRFHLPTAKHGVVVCLWPQWSCVSASTSIINPSNARDGADDHAALSAMEIYEPAPDAAASRHRLRRAGGGGNWFRIVARGLGANGRRPGAAADHASGE